MSFTEVAHLDASLDKANAWLTDIDAGFGTGDRHPAYIARFAREARVRESDVAKAARIVSAVARQHMSAGVVAEAFALLPASLRDLLEPAAAGPGGGAER